MTNPQAPFQTEQSATQHTEALVRAEGMLGTVELHGGSLITIDHEASRPWLRRHAMWRSRSRPSSTSF